jgi:hypothetical protein
MPESGGISYAKPGRPGGQRLRGGGSHSVGTPGVFLEQAAVHHHEQSGGAGPGRRGLVEDSLLKPHGPRSDGDGLIDDVSCFFGTSEHIHDVDGPGERRQIRVAPQAENLVERWVYRRNSKVLLKEIAGNLVGRPIGAPGDPHHGDVTVAAEEGEDGFNCSVLLVHARRVVAGQHNGKAGRPPLLETQESAE